MFRVRLDPRETVMPIYEYVCQSCGHETEHLQKLSDPPLAECPSCHATAMVKNISAAGFRLSGGGWYETDFKKSDKKKNVAGEAKDATPACTPTGCEKPACAAKAETPAKSAEKPAKSTAAA
jgi:putative FmdB family regulatory protein